MKTDYRVVFTRDLEAEGRDFAFYPEDLFLALKKDLKTLYLPKKMSSIGNVEMNEGSETCVSLYREICRSLDLAASKEDRDITLCSFHHVNIHTDNITPRGYKTFVLMLEGTGELGYWDLKRGRYQSGEHISLSPGLGVVFNDRNPHCFIAAKSNPCRAMIGAVKA